MNKSSSVRAILLGIVLIGGAVAFGVWWRSRPSGDKMAAATTANHRGVAHRERFEDDEACAAFEEALRLAPDWPVAKINLAIALMNNIPPTAKDPTDETLGRARQLFTEVLKQDENNPYAHYCLGIIYNHKGDAASALPHFAAVTRADPNDAGAWYHLGFCLEQTQGDPATIRDCYSRALKLSPYMNAAIYNLSMKLRDLDPAKTKALLAEHQLLEIADRFTETKIQYTSMGSPYAEVIATVAGAKPQPAPLPKFQLDDSVRIDLAEGTRWATAADLDDARKAIRQRFGATLIRLDFNGDRKPDLFLLSAVVQNGKVRDLLLKNESHNRFTDATAAVGLGQPIPSVGCAAADYDNDGRTDLLITTTDGVRLFRNEGERFTDFTSVADMAGLKGPFLGCAWADLDQDVDLDLLLAGANGVVVFVNAGEGPMQPEDAPAFPLSTRFRRLDKLDGLIGPAIPHVGFAVTDADNDRDPDVLFLADGTSLRLALDDRVLRYHSAALPGGTAPSGTWNGALVLDADQDGRSDLLIVGPDRAPILLLNRCGPGETNAERFYEPGTTTAPPLRQAQVADVDRDGWPDVVGLSGDGRPVLLHNDRTGKLTPVAEGEWPANVVAVAMTDLVGDGAPDAIVWSDDGLQVRRNLGNGNRGMKLQPTGVRVKGKSMRTNADGIGAVVAVTAGPVRTSIENTTLSAGLGQSRLPLELGIGRARQADLVQIRWPDLVRQAEMSVPADDWTQIREANRKGTSCPVLFLWDGERFRYVTDFLGAGALGEIGVDGGIRPPRPEESLALPPGLLKPKDGSFVLKIAEPMDEVLYLDHLKLVAIDHPADTVVVPDERFVTAGPPPSQQLLAFRQRFAPTRAIDHRGRDVTDLLRERDEKTVEKFAVRSWMGYAEDHWIELEFGELAKSVGANDKLYLVLAGWTDYPYPESIYAATQAGVALVPPVLERFENGEWKALLDLGFPAGLPREMTREVPASLASGGRYRIRTNMQVYWDRIVLAPLAPMPEAVTVLDPASATMAVRGFYRELPPDSSGLIGYDPDRTVPVAVARWSGNRTKLGDVTELVRGVDDRFAICGPGDEVTVTFDARKLPSLPAGWSRSFVLRSWGYCKDTTPFTTTGASVEPLPFRAMKRYPPGPEEKYPHPKDRETWHTRP